MCPTLGVICGSQLTFLEHLEAVIAKFNKTIWLLRKLLIFYWDLYLSSNIKPFIVCTKISVMFCMTKHTIYHFNEKLKTGKWSACFAIIQEMRGTSRDKISQDVCLEPLENTVLKILKTLYRSSHGRYSVEKGVLKNFANFTGNTCVGVFSLIKLQVFRPATLLKRYSNKGVFLWNLQNF